MFIVIKSEHYDCTNLMPLPDISTLSTGYFDPEEDKRSGEVDSLTGYYYVDI